MSYLRPYDRFQFTSCRVGHRQSFCFGPVTFKFHLKYREKSWNIDDFGFMIQNTLDGISLSCYHHVLVPNVSCMNFILDAWYCCFESESNLISTMRAFNSNAAGLGHCPGSFLCCLRLINGVSNLFQEFWFLLSKSNAFKKIIPA